MLGRRRPAGAGRDGQLSQEDIDGGRRRRPRALRRHHRRRRARTRCSRSPAAGPPATPASACSRATPTARSARGSCSSRATRSASPRHSSRSFDVMQPSLRGRRPELLPELVPPDPVHVERQPVQGGQGEEAQEGAGEVLPAVARSSGCRHRTADADHRAAPAAPRGRATSPRRSAATCTPRPAAPWCSSPRPSPRCCGRTSRRAPTRRCGRRGWRIVARRPRAGRGPARLDQRGADDAVLPRRRAGGQARAGPRRAARAHAPGDPGRRVAGRDGDRRGALSGDQRRRRRRGRLGRGGLDRHGAGARRARAAHPRARDPAARVPADGRRDRRPRRRCW